MDMTNDLSKRAGEEQQRCVTRSSWLLKRVWIQSWKDPQQIETDQHCHQQWKLFTYYIHCCTMQMRWGGNNVHVIWLPHKRLDQLCHRPRRWTHQCSSGLSGCDTVGCSAKVKQHMCQQWQWLFIGDVGLGAFGDYGTDISRVTTTRHKSIGNLYSFSKQHGKY